MGRCEIGVEDIDGKIVPFVSFCLDEGRRRLVTFRADMSVKDGDEGRKICAAIVEILSGPKKNFLYDRDGNA